MLRPKLEAKAVTSYTASSPCAIPDVRRTHYGFPGPRLSMEKVPRSQIKRPKPRCNNADPCDEKSLHSASANVASMMVPLTASRIPLRLLVQHEIRHILQDILLNSLGTDHRGPRARRAGYGLLPSDASVRSQLTCGRTTYELVKLYPGWKTRTA